MENTTLLLSSPPLGAGPIADALTQLSTALHHLSMDEKRLIAFAISGSQLPFGFGCENAGWKVKLFDSDCVTIFSESPMCAYVRVKEALDTLFGRHVEYAVQGPRGRRAIRKSRWISGVSSEPSGRTVEFNLSPEMCDQLRALKQRLFVDCRDAQPKGAEG